MNILYSARSHIGWVRENNEDNLYVDGIILPPDTAKRPFAIDGSTNSSVIFAICDGMGGEENGEIASRLAVETLINEDTRLKSTSSEMQSKAVEVYVNSVNEKIRLNMINYGKRSGTTLALVIVSSNEIHCFNIGDSRIYCLQKTAFRQISNDHTLFAEQIRECSTTPSQVRNKEGKNKLTRCIGIGDTPKAESYSPIFGNCRILICSDGLTDMVSAGEIEQVLQVSVRVADAANALLGMALGNGGKDNVSLIVLDVKDTKKAFLSRFAKKPKEWSRA